MAALAQLCCRPAAAYTARASGRQAAFCRRLSCRAAAEGEAGEAAALASAIEAFEQQQGEVATRDDDVLPDNLEDALCQAGQTTALAVEGVRHSAASRELPYPGEAEAGRCGLTRVQTQGCLRALVEVQVPELFDVLSGNIMAEEGDQQRYVESLAAALGADGGEGGTVRAVFPDAGCAAYLKQRWGDKLPFRLASLNDRLVVQPGDVAVVVCAPDPQGVEASQRVASACGETVACVLLNPRLASGDAGVGLNARRLRDRFVGGFTVAYSLRPFGDGTVFKRYPGNYKVFGPDPDRRGRLLLLSEQLRRPDSEEVADLMLAASGAAASDAEGGTGVLESLVKIVGSMFRFMSSLAK